ARQPRALDEHGPAPGGARAGPGAAPPPAGGAGRPAGPAARARAALAAPPPAGVPPEQPQLLLQPRRGRLREDLRRLPAALLRLLRGERRGQDAVRAVQEL